MFATTQGPVLRTTYPVAVGEGQRVGPVGDFHVLLLVRLSRPAAQRLREPPAAGLGDVGAVRAGCLRRRGDAGRAHRPPERGGRQPLAGQGRQRRRRPLHRGARLPAGLAGRRLRVSH